MKTKITELLGIEYPVIQGGMAWVAEASLAAAVSDAGGLGLIAAAAAPAEWVRAVSYTHLFHSDLLSLINKGQTFQHKIHDSKHFFAVNADFSLGNIVADASWFIVIFNNI